MTVTPGSTPPELSLTVPSMVPLAAVDCANAGAASASDNIPESKYFSMFSSIPRFIGGLPGECEELVSRIHFFEVVS